MALNLKVHWREELLRVDYPTIGEVIGEIRAKEQVSSHVQLEGQGENDVLVKDFFEENCKVRDVSRFRICAEDCSVHHDGRYRICNDRYIIPHYDVYGEKYDVSEPEESLLSLQQLLLLQHIGNIVLLLESPHKKEYGKEGNVYYINRPLVPAKGSTGENIDRDLGMVLSRIDDQQLIMPGCHVIISNPIQFQASLHAIHGQSLRERTGKWRTLRDHVWQTLWNEEDEYIKKCFLDRLEGYYPKVIINACTGKLDEDGSLKRLVNDFVYAQLPHVPLFTVAHPASWQNLHPKRFIPPTNPDADSP